MDVDGWTLFYSTLGAILLCTLTLSAALFGSGLLTIITFGLFNNKSTGFDIEYMDDLDATLIIATILILCVFLAFMVYIYLMVDTWVGSLLLPLALIVSSGIITALALEGWYIIRPAVKALHRAVPLLLPFFMAFPIAFVGRWSFFVGFFVIPIILVLGGGGMILVYKLFFANTAPTSSISQADPARKVGQLGEALRLHTLAGRDEQAIECLYDLPDWPVRTSLVNTASELLQLKKSTVIALNAGAPRPIALELAQQADSAAGALWRIADRLAAVAAQEVEYSSIASGLKKVDATITQLAQETAKTRKSLAVITLPDMDGYDIDMKQLEDAATRLRMLAWVAVENLQETVQPPNTDKQ
jgi:hypothetical protein